MKGFVLILITYLLVAVPVSAQEAVYVKKVSKAPVIDGKIDAVWDSATPAIIKVAKIPEKIISVNLEKQKGKYAKNWKKTGYTQISEVEIKAVHTDDRIYFMARWQDDTKDDQHKPWVWQGDKKTGEYVAGKEREDRLSFMFPIKGIFDANMLSDKEAVIDVWQWKAARTNPAGIIHDKSHIYSKSPIKGKYSIHYTVKGSEIYVSRPGDGNISPYKSSKIDPFKYIGQTTPKYIPFVPEDENASNVKAKGIWESGGWTVEATRLLNTGYPETDTVFDPSQDTEMSLAVFNHAGDHFHAVSELIKVVFD